MIPYSHQHIDEDDIRTVIDVLKSDWLTQGEKIEEFEKALAFYCDARYAVVVSSGTAALHLALKVLGIGKGDTVVTSPLSFVASSNCAIYVGAAPAFVDIDPETYTLSSRHLESFFKQKKPKAVIPIHYGGFPAAMKEIRCIAQKGASWVIEDASHALGAKYDSQKVGSCQFSDMTIFSFHPVKTITTGEGGAILTNNEGMYKKLKCLRSHSIEKKAGEGTWYYEVTDIGYNYRLTDIQAALGISQLKKCNRFIEKRRIWANYYFSLLKENERIILPPRDEHFGVRSAWHLFPIQLNISNIERTKKELVQYLRNQGIGVQVHYIPIHLHPYYQKEFGFKKGDFPIAEEIYQKILSLPLYVDLTEEHIKFIVQTLNQGIQLFK